MGMRANRIIALLSEYMAERLNKVEMKVHLQQTPSYGFICVQYLSRACLYIAFHCPFASPTFPP